MANNKIMQDIPRDALGGDIYISPYVDDLLKSLNGVNLFEGSDVVQPENKESEKMTTTNTPIMSPARFAEDMDLQSYIDRFDSVKSHYGIARYAIFFSFDDRLLGVRAYSKLKVDKGGLITIFNLQFQPKQLLWEYNFYDRLRNMTALATNRNKVKCLIVEGEEDPKWATMQRLQWNQGKLILPNGNLVLK